MGGHEIDAYKDVLKHEFAANENLFKSRFGQALISPVTSVTVAAAYDLVSERAALQMRLDQVSSAAQLHPEAGLAAGDIA